MRILAVLPLLALAACVQPEANSVTKPDPDLCKASGMTGLIGQPKTVLKSMMLPAGSRVIGPNDPVTMDFRPDRLNVEIGADDRIAKIACY